jgi:hypothetical protein
MRRALIETIAGNLEAILTVESKRHFLTVQLARDDLILNAFTMTTVAEIEFWRRVEAKRKS